MAYRKAPRKSAPRRTSGGKAAGGGGQYRAGAGRSAFGGKRPAAGRTGSGGSDRLRTIRIVIEQPGTSSPSRANVSASEVKPKKSPF
jgi:hypothetical protein